MHRYRVAEDSMRPALAPGDEFVSTASRQAVVGEIVALPHPERGDFWLVKRLGAGPGQLVEGHGVLGEGMAWVDSDNRLVDGHDSRSFGPVPIATLRPRVEHLDEVTFAEATMLLAGEEPAFARVIDEFGPPPFWSRPAGFPTLVWLIMEQQVSLESGAAMFRRLHELLGSIDPDTLRAATESDLRGIGVTRQKAPYLLQLAEAVATGDLDLGSMSDRPVAEARQALLAIKGIGPWTADAYLLSALRFPDVFPVGDRALQVGTAEVLAMSSIPNEGELELISLPWRPIRAAAARIIWHSYLMRRGRTEPPDPTS
ncbi:MAG TPA: S26 family signal peptidase [Acidimicrobiia bacterium]|nr:S26 family signal peptidase [Acidimicrobiia bacterium]